MSDVGDAQHRSIGIMIVELTTAVVVLVILDLAFWLTSDFRTFTAGTEGTLGEKLYCAGVTASGPFAYPIMFGLGDAAQAFGVAFMFTVLPIGASIYWRRWIVARLAGYLGVVLWFFLGFSVIGIIIT